MNDYFKELDTPVYQGSFRITQTNSSGGTCEINIEATRGSRIMIDSAMVVLPNTASGRTIYIRVYDSDDNEIQRFAYVGLDNQRVFIPSQGLNANGANNATNKQFFTLVNGDYLNVHGFTFAQNEYFDLRVRGYVRGRMPNVTTTGSTGDVTLTTNYSRVV